MLFMISVLHISIIMIADGISIISFNYCLENVTVHPIIIYVGCLY